MCAEEEEEEEEEEEDEEATPEDIIESAMDESVDASGLQTPMSDGISSVTSGLTTPGVVDLRKGARLVSSGALRSIVDDRTGTHVLCGGHSSGTETPDAPQQLYTVLEQKEVSDVVELIAAD